MAAAPEVGNFNAQEVANTPRVISKAGQSDAPRFASVGMAAEQDVGDFKAQKLTNT